MSGMPDFLENAIDLHVHSAPDVDHRRYNDLELAREAAAAGMGAILIKSHQNSTVERAWLVSKVVTGIQVFGGLVLNETVGGLNVAAVKLALAMGAKEIWMPKLEEFPFLIRAATWFRMRTPFWKQSRRRIASSALVI
jgi:hypothetical protein